MKKLLLMLWAIVMITGCASQEIAQAHKGRMFEKTGLLAFYSGGKGFAGPVLGPGTYYTGIYNDIRLVSCEQETRKESLGALTKDGVQFGLDIYVQSAANCDDEDAVKRILSTLSPEKNDTITGDEIYSTYVRPALGGSVREAVSMYIANDVNSKRDEIFSKMKEQFVAAVGESKLVKVFNLTLSNLLVPDQLEHANVDRATQAVLKDKAVAERERVTAEIETTKMRRELAVNEADNDVARITAIGKALRTFPEYLQYDAQQRWNDIYFHAGEKGNLIIAAPMPSLQLPIKK